MQLELNNVALAGCHDCTEIYQLWIMENTTRRKLIFTLRAIGQNNITHNYEHYLKTNYISNS